MKITKIVVGYLSTNCYIVFDEKTKDAVVIDPGADGYEILKSIKKEQLVVRSIINTHSHFDHTGANDFIKEKTGAALFMPGKDGETKNLGSLNFQFYLTPGHTPDGISLLTEGHLFPGDTLFAGSIGRTDLSGNLEKLLNSIKEKLLILPGSTVVHPGHGPDTTIEEEIEHNPFLK